MDVESTPLISDEREKSSGRRLEDVEVEGREEHDTPVVPSHSFRMEAIEVVKGHVPEGYPTYRAWMHDLVEGDFDSPVEYFILVLILLNVFSFMLGTVLVEGTPPCYNKCVTINDRYDPFFEAFEAFSVIIFTIEYGFRMWCCLEDPTYGAKVTGLKLASEMRADTYLGVVFRDLHAQRLSSSLTCGT